MSDLLNILHLKVRPKPLEPNANQEDIHLTPLQLIAVTNTLAERISWNPSVRRILMAEDLSQIRCYNCNKIGHIAKYCRNKKKSYYTSKKKKSLDMHFASTRNDLHLVLTSNVIRNELIHSHLSRTYEVFSCRFWVKSVVFPCFHSKNVNTCNKDWFSLVPTPLTTVIKLTIQFIKRLTRRRLEAIL